MLDKLLPEYVQNPGDPEINWKLGLAYRDIGQTASALSFFLRCAERAENNLLLQYEALLYASKSYTDQGRRGISVRGLLQHAISILPKRPEAYYLYAIQCQKDDTFPNTFFDSYLLCSIALDVCLPDNQLEPLRTDVGYPGRFALLIQKGFVAWHTGKCDESREIFMDLYDNYVMPAKYKKIVHDNMKDFTKKYYFTHSHYDTQKTYEFERWLNKDLATFEWGELHKERREYIHESYGGELYLNFFPVEPGDIVVDIGSDVGSFSTYIRKYNPKRVLCTEKNKKLEKTLVSNTKELDYIDIVDYIPLEEMLKKYSIEKVDILKLSCHGDEYNILKNYSFIKKNVRFLVGKFHLHTPEYKKQFKEFRDTYLKNNDFRILTLDEVDTTDGVWKQEFIDYYARVYVYVDLLEQAAMPLPL